MAGIPVLKGEASGDDWIRSIVGLVERGQHEEALLSMLASSVPTQADPGGSSLGALRIPGVGRLRTHLVRRGMKRWRATLGAALAGPTRVTALRMLDLYFHESPTKRPTAYEYFAFRFGQPRHLVALSLISSIREPTAPIIELACGFGHISRSLVFRGRGQPVIGIDRSFYPLYVAKHWIAPEAIFVCHAIGAAGIPFEGNVFSAAVCVDGLHYIASKAVTVREVKRVTRDDGVIIFASSRNASVPYIHQGLPLPWEGYRELFADMRHCLLPDGEILARYLARRPAPLSQSSDAAHLVTAPLVSLVASRRAEIFRDHDVFNAWPHAEGRRGINPLYVEQPHDDGGSVLRRAFPSTFYVEDNPEIDRYLPESVEITADTRSALRDGRHTADVEALVAQCVVIGLPDGYGQRDAL